MNFKFLTSIIQLLAICLLVVCCSCSVLWAKMIAKPSEYYTVVSRNWNIEKPKVAFDFFGRQCFKGPFKLTVRDNNKSLKWNFRTSDFINVMAAMEPSKVRASVYHRLIELSEKSGNVGIKATLWMNPKPTVVDIEAIPSDKHLPVTTTITKHVGTVEGYKKSSDVKELLKSEQETSFSNQYFFVSADSFCTELDIYEWLEHSWLMFLLVVSIPVGFIVMVLMKRNSK